MNLSNKKNQLVVFIVSFLLLFITVASTVEAGKGNRRAAGFTSKGVASSGSIKKQAKAYKNTKRNTRDNKYERREDYRDYKQERREDSRDERREDRYDYRDERRERWEDRRTLRRIVGAAALSAVAYQGLRCRHESVFVDGFTYSRCGNEWYEPVHRGGNVTYIIVEAPYGY
jgi:hypothetical protein